MPIRFRQSIKSAMRDREVGVTSLSRRSGVALPNLSRFLAGKADLTTANLERLCIALDLELCQRTEKTKPDAKGIGPRRPKREGAR